MEQNTSQTNKIEVRLISINTTSGVSQSGKQWTKHELVTETLDQYPKKIKFDRFGDIMTLVEGNCYMIEFVVNSREFNGRWYTDINIVSIAPTQINVPIEQAHQQIQQRTQQQMDAQRQMDAKADAFFNIQPSPSSGFSDGGNEGLHF